ncbi:MAG: hypothetical protein GXP26_11950 [Planctomycetes bacterium]|nr:hypothetical protein [Planctomycetota bacterium]
MNKTSDKAPKKQFASRVQFQDWLVAMIDRIDELVLQLEDDPELLSSCGAIVHEAGEHCTRLGYPNLYQTSVGAAPYCNSPEAGVYDYLCTESKAKKFLSECLKVCNDEIRLTSGVNRETVEDFSRTAKKSGATAPGIAFSQFMEATHALGGKPTDNQAYERAKTQAESEGVSIQICDTWKRNLRKAREARGEQKCAVKKGSG